MHVSFSGPFPCYTTQNEESVKHNFPLHLSNLTNDVSISSTRHVLITKQSAVLSSKSHEWRVVPCGDWASCHHQRLWAPIYNYSSQNCCSSVVWLYRYRLRASFIQISINMPFQITLGWQSKCCCNSNSRGLNNNPSIERVRQASGHGDQWQYIPSLQKALCKCWSEDQLLGEFADDTNQCTIFIFQSLVVSSQIC